MAQLAFWLSMLAVIATGLIAGASVDQSIKQLPARHRIDIEAYSAYSQAADLGNGILLYSVLGISSALLSIAASIAVRAAHLSASAIPADLGAVLAVLHSLVTTRAAPTLFEQRQFAGDRHTLARIFDRFTRWQTARAMLQVLAFGALLWSVATVARST